MSSPLARGAGGSGLPRKVFGCLWLAFALPLVPLAALFAANDGWHRSASHAEGVVTALRASGISNRSPSCTVVAFVDAAGQRREFVSRYYCSRTSPPFAVGETVPVLYDPGSPRRAEIDGFQSRWVGTIVFCGVVAFFLVICFAVWRFSWRRPAEGPA